MAHSLSGWMRGVQVKLWDSLRMHATPERLRRVFTTRRCTNPPLPYLTLPSVRTNFVASISIQDFLLYSVSGSLIILPHDYHVWVFHDNKLLLCLYWFVQLIWYCHVSHHFKDPDCLSVKYRISYLTMHWWLQVYPDAACRRELNQLPVHCCYSGCDWKGVLKDYEVNFSFAVWRTTLFIHQILLNFPAIALIFIHLCNWTVIIISSSSSSYSFICNMTERMSLHV